MEVTTQPPELVEDVTDTVVAINTDDRPVRLAGYLILLVMLGFFGTWSAFAPLDSAAVATGTVAVKSHRKTVQSLEGGIVKEIRVRDGDLVQKGDILLVLDDTQIKAQLNILQGRYISLAAIIARLNAEQRQAESIVFPDEFDNLHDPRVIEAIRDQQQIFQTRRSSLQGELALLNQEVKQLALKIQGLRIQKQSKQQLAKLYAEEIQDLNALLAEGFADKQRLRELQRNRTQIVSDIAALTTEIASTQMQLSKTKLKIIQVKRRFQEDVATQLEKFNAELFSIKEQLTMVKDKAEHTVIKAPVRGIILGMSAHTVGGGDWPGQSNFTYYPGR
jgi:epimerase transport system membrane fusion protein